MPDNFTTMDNTSAEKISMVTPHKDTGIDGSLSKTDNNESEPLFCEPDNFDKLIVDDLETKNKSGVSKLIGAFKHLTGDLGLNWEDGKEKPVKEHIPISQTENDVSNKLESPETTNLNVDQSDKDDNQIEGYIDPADIPEDPSEKTGDEEQLDSDYSNDAKLTETDESKADD